MSENPRVKCTQLHYMVGAAPSPVTKHSDQAGWGVGVGVEVVGGEARFRCRDAGWGAGQQRAQHQHVLRSAASLPGNADRNSDCGHGPPQA